jgi:hypothetical protein
MNHPEETCGQELAASAVIPELLARLFKHVAANLRDHAAWVGTSSPPAEREHEALNSVAQGYEAVGTEAQRTANLMRTLKDLQPTVHDPQGWDGAKFAVWMRTKIELQSRLAKLLLEHAEQSERVLEQMQRGAAE